MEKPNVLVLGATGFIGRNLVRMLVKEDIANVTAADKVLPACAYLSKEEESIFEKVDFKQKNLVNPAHIASLWEGANFDYVVNLAAETKYGHTDEVYKERVEHIAVSCAKEAAKRKAKRFIEVSTAQVYEPTNKPKKESGKLVPWTNIAKYKLKVEEELKGISGLNYAVIRPSVVYGPGDRLGLAPRIICGAVYKKLNEPMKFLWNKDLKLNTVHVDDVCRAIVHLFTSGDSGCTYNLSDKSNSDQGSINVLLEQVYGIKTKFAGKILSSAISKLSMTSVAREANDKHVAPWAEITKESGISITPLSPYIDQELLYKKHLCVDGSGIEKIGFKYAHPKVTVDHIKSWIAYYTALGLFPKKYAS